MSRVRRAGVLVLLALCAQPRPPLARAADSGPTQVVSRYSRVTGEPGTQGLAQVVAALIDRAAPAAAGVTGTSNLAPVRAWVFANRKPFSAATGVTVGSPVVGLSVFPQEVIYLDGSGALVSLQRVVPHEVGHVMECRAVGPGAPALPRWFNEGVAEHLAGPEPAYVEAAAWAGLRQGGTLPMSKLEEAFGEPDRRGTAYAESASLVEFLIRRSGEGAIAAILGDLRRGADFPTALRRASGKTPAEFEAEWRESLRSSWLFVPDLNTMLWLVMVVLLLVAFVRMLRKRRKPEEPEEVEMELGAEYHDDE